MENEIIDLVTKTAAVTGTHTTIKIAINEISAFIKSFRKKEKTPEEEEAVQALYKALCKTKNYISKLKSGECELSKQDDLFRYWDTACDKLYNLDLDLALLCNGKGRYWLNPNSWSPEDIKNAGIEINKITKDIEHFRQKG